MTPEHEYTLWVTGLAALPTIVLTGAAGFWAWWRDQERIIVQKSPLHWKSLDGTESNVNLGGVGVVVRNLSLYPVRIAGLGFFIDGKTSFPFDRDEHDEKEWPPEVASHARIIVYANDKEWKRLKGLGLSDRIMDTKSLAVAVTETGSRFTSDRLSVRTKRRFRNVRQWFKKNA